MADKQFLNWLHITDIHVGQPREGGRLANIERAFLEDLTRVVKEEGPISLVFLSGDVAFRGVDAEYVRASAILGRVCSHLDELNQGVTPVLVPVPGNHDLVRPNPRDADSIRAALASRSGMSPPLWPSGQESVRDLVDKCFAGYRTWLRTHPLPFPPGAHHGVLPGDLRATITRRGISVGVLGLNSACLHLADEEPGSQHLDLSQVVHLIGPNPRGWIESHHFNVLVTHHPPSWLSPTACGILNEEIKPNALFDLHLYGHDHAGRASTDPGTNGIRHLLEGRSLFGAEEHGSERIHGYSVGRFVLEPSEGKSHSKRVEFWTRQGWRDGHGWHFGPSDEHWGRWRLHIDLGKTKLASASDTPAPDSFPRGLGRLDKTAPWTLIDRPSELGEALDTDAKRRWILLSASIPIPLQDPERRAAERDHIESARPDAIRAFVLELARRVSASENLGIIFGGHPTIAQTLAPIVLAPSTGEPWLALIQDEHFWFNLVEEVGVLAHAKRVRPFLVRTAGTGPNLTALREAMLSPKQLAAAVFVGGMSGICEEFAMTGERRPGVPRHAVGLGGGAAAALLLDPETASAATGSIENSARVWHTASAAVDAILDAIG